MTASLGLGVGTLRVGKFGQVGRGLGGGWGGVGSLRDGKFGVGRGRGVLPGGGWGKGWGEGGGGHCVTASLGLGVGTLVRGKFWSRREGGTGDGLGVGRGDTGGREFMVESGRGVFRGWGEGGGGFRGEGWGGMGGGKGGGIWGGREGWGGGSFGAGGFARTTGAGSGSRGEDGSTREGREGGHSCSRGEGWVGGMREDNGRGGFVFAGEGYSLAGGRREGDGFLARGHGRGMGLSPVCTGAGFRREDTGGEGGFGFARGGLAGGVRGGGGYSRGQEAEGVPRRGGYSRGHGRGGFVFAGGGMGFCVRVRRAGRREDTGWGRIRGRGRDGLAGGGMGWRMREDTGRGRDGGEGAGFAGRGGCWFLCLLLAIVGLSRGRGEVKDLYMKVPCVYMLASKPRGTLYVGATSDLVQRVWQHKGNLVGRVHQAV